MGGHWGRWGLRGHWGRSCLKSVINDSCYALATLDQVGDLSPKGRVAEGNDKKDSTIIKINSDLPSATPTRPFGERSPT
ncbi:MAG: hypothetical protein LBB88_02970 [Planctomycetaceae bacterium]|nr:hypothetical protein [Planctomycetaceae bacterium]